LIDLVCVKTKPFAQNFTCVLSKLGDGLMSGVRPTLAAAVASAVAALGGSYAATSVLPSKCGISLRLACSSGAMLQAATNAAWTAIRCRLTGSPPGRRRI
jgi:hypothetical protein